MDGLWLSTRDLGLAGTGAVTKVTSHWDPNWVTRIVKSHGINTSKWWLGQVSTGFSVEEIQLKNQPTGLLSLKYE